MSESKPPITVDGIFAELETKELAQARAAAEKGDRERAIFSNFAEVAKASILPAFEQLKAELAPRNCEAKISTRGPVLANDGYSYPQVELSVSFPAGDMRYIGTFSVHYSCTPNERHVLRTAVRVTKPRSNRSDDHSVDVDTAKLTKESVHQFVLLHLKDVLLNR